MKLSSLLHAARLKFHEQLTKELLVITADGVPSNADKDSNPSTEIALTLATRIPGVGRGEKLRGQTAGSQFELICRDFIERAWSSLDHLRPGSWIVDRLTSKSQLALAAYDQYSHLQSLAEFVESHPELTTVLGNDYSVTPDIVVSREPLSDSAVNMSGPVVDDEIARRTPLRRVNSGSPILHAAISCKWTIRSDRAQNARAEALNLIRNRKGNLPHIKFVTAEPLPGRIASLALGTGDIDCVYHIALPELHDAVSESGYEDSMEMLETMIRGRRLRDITDLPLDLAI